MADPSGQVLALNLENGKNLWTSKLKETITAGVTVTPSCLLVTTQNGFSHCLSSFFLYRYGAPRDLHSFPTRRSSDLIVVATREVTREHGEARVASPRVGTVHRGRAFGVVPVSPRHCRARVHDFADFAVGRLGAPSPQIGRAHV